MLNYGLELQLSQSVLLVLFVSEDEDDEGDDQPGPKIHSIETTHLPEQKPDSADNKFGTEDIHSNRSDSESVAGGRGCSDAGDPDHSEGTNDDNLNNTDGNTGSGSGNADPGGNDNGSSSGNAGNDGSASGDENKRNSNPEKPNTDEDDTTNMPVDDDDESFKKRAPSPDGDTNQPVSETEIDWHEAANSDRDPHDNSPQPSEVEVVTAKRCVASPDKGKKTSYLTIKRSRLAAEDTMSVTVDRCDEPPEASSSEVSELELMSSLQLKRIVDHDSSSTPMEPTTKPDDPKPVASANEIQTVVTSDQPRVEFSQEERALIFTNILASYFQSTSRIIQESRGNPGPFRRSMLRRPNRPQPYPRRRGRARYLPESPEERLSRIYQQDRVNNQSSYDQAQGPSGLCADSEDSQQTYILAATSPSSSEPKFTLTYSPTSCTVHDDEESDSTTKPCPIDLSKKP